MILKGFCHLNDYRYQYSSYYYHKPFKRYTIMAKFIRLVCLQQHQKSLFCFLLFSIKAYQFGFNEIIDQLCTKILLFSQLPRIECAIGKMGGALEMGFKFLSTLLYPLHHVARDKDWYPTTFSHAAPYSFQWVVPCSVIWNRVTIPKWQRRFQMDRLIGLSCSATQVLLIIMSRVIQPDGMNTDGTLVARLSSVGQGYSGVLPRNITQPVGE